MNELTSTSVYTTIPRSPQLASSTSGSRSDIVFTLEILELFILALVLFGEVSDHLLDLHRELRDAMWLTCRCH